MHGSGLRCLGTYGWLYIVLSGWGYQGVPVRTVTRDLCSTNLLMRFAGAVPCTAADCALFYTALSPAPWLMVCRIPPRLCTSSVPDVEVANCWCLKSYEQQWTASPGDNRQVHLYDGACTQCTLHCVEICMGRVHCVCKCVSATWQLDPDNCTRMNWIRLWDPYISRTGPRNWVKFAVVCFWVVLFPTVKLFFPQSR